MKILIIASWYQNETNIIRGSFFREQAQALKRSGHDVTVISVEQYSTSIASMSRIGKFEDYDDKGVRTIIYNQLSLGSCSTSFGYKKLKIKYDFFLERNLSGYKKIYNKLAAEGKNYDVVHAHSFLPGGYAACKLKDILGAPVIVTEHCSAIPGGKLTKERVEGLRYTVENADAFYCVSRNLAESVYRETGLDTNSYRIGVIPNILSPLFYYDPNVKKYDNFTFISVGQLIPRKKMDYLIDSFAKAFDSSNDVKLLIAGDGISKNQLQEKISAYGLNDHITLLGRISREELAQTMKRCHAFVLMSQLETFGVVYIEAMACGLPTVGTYNGGSDEILDTFGGIGLRINDERLSDVLISLKNGNIKVKGFELSSRIINAFGEKSVVNKIESAYKQVVENYK